MAASERDYSKTTPPPVAGAHHGPGAAGPTLSETFNQLAEKLKQRGWFNYRLLAIVVLLIVGIVVWRYIVSVKVTSVSAEWFELGMADTVEKLEGIAKRDANAPVGRMADLDLARYYLAGPDVGIDGLKLLDPEKRAKAIENVEKARKMFLDLADKFKADKNLTCQCECLLGAAVAEEALIGVPQGASTSETRGSVAKAVEYYKKLAEAAPGTKMGERAEKRAAELEQKTNDITKIQSKFYNEMTAPSPTLPPFSPPGGAPFGAIPGLPGGPFPPLPTPPSSSGGPKLEPGPAVKPELPPRIPDPSVAPVIPPGPPPAKK